MVTLAKRQELKCGPPERVTLAERQIIFVGDMEEEF